MKKGVVKKSLVFGIIVLMVGAGVVQNIKTTAKADPTDGLVGYWSFDDGTATDQSGNGNNGIINGATTTSGVSNGALQFDGTNDYVDLPDNEFKFQQFSISCWASCDSFGYFPPIFSVMNQAGYGGWVLEEGVRYIDNTMNFITADIAGHEIDMIRSQPVETGRWYHIVGVKTPSFMRIYVDGELAEEDTDVSLVTYSGCYYGDDFLPFIGCTMNVHILDRYFNGKIDEVRIYNRALSATEIEDLFLQNNPYGKGNILIYSTTSVIGVYDKTYFDNDLPTILGNYGYYAYVTDRILTPQITSSLLSNYDQLWILSTYPPSVAQFSQSEIDIILNFRNQGNGLLIMADHTGLPEDYADAANQISESLGVTFIGITNQGPNGQPIEPDFVSHPLFYGVETIVAGSNEGNMAIDAPVEVIATYQGVNLIAALDDGLGKVVFDVSFTRLWDAGWLGLNWILVGDTPQYVRNIADWLSGGNQPLVVDAGGPYTGIAGEEIQFMGSASGGTPPYTWLWNFGNEETSTEQNPFYASDEPKTFTVSVEVKDNQDQTATDITSVTIIKSVELPFYDEFENILSDNYPDTSGWINFANGIDAKVTTTSAYNSKKSFQLEGSANLPRIDGIQLPNNIPQKLTYEFFVKVPDAAKGTTIGFLGQNVNTIRFNCIHFSNDGGIYFIKDISETTTNYLQNYIPNMWYKITVDLDFSTQKAKVYINGSRMGGEFTIYSDQTINKFCIGTNTFTGNDVGKINFDDIRIYSTTESSRIKVVPTNYSDIIGNVFSDAQINDIRDMMEKVCRYYFKESFKKLNLCYIIADLITLNWMNGNDKNYPDSVPGDEGYSPPQKYANEVTGLVGTEGIEALVAFQILPAGNGNFRAIAWDLTNDPPGVINPRFLVACQEINNYWGTIAHEIGHALLDFKDYYITAPSPNGNFYDWSLMGGGNDLIPPAPIDCVNKIIAPGRKTPLNWLEKIPYTLTEEEDTKTVTMVDYLQLNPDENNDENKIPVFLSEDSKHNKYEFWLEARNTLDPPTTPDPVPSIKGIVIYKKDNFGKYNFIPSATDTNTPTLRQGKLEYSDPNTCLVFTYDTPDDQIFKVTAKYDASKFKDKEGVKLKSLSNDVLGPSASPYVGYFYDFDLHAYTTNGLHVGMNYVSGEYECQIPETICSGNTLFEEYIIVPIGTEVTFKVQLNGNINGIFNYTTQVIQGSSNPQIRFLEDGIVEYLNYSISDRVLRQLNVGETTEDIDGDGIPFYQELIDGTNPNDGPILSLNLSVLTAQPSEFTKDSTFALPIKVKAGDVYIQGANITLKSEYGVLFSNVVDLGDGNYSVTVTIPEDYPTNILNVTVNATRTGFINGSSEITLFRTLPTTVKTIGNPKHGSNNEWVSSSTKFNLSATDDLSGVNKIYYRIWYNSIWTPWMEYLQNFTLAGEGKHYLEYYSVDTVGNVEDTHNQTHYVDDSLPVVTISASPTILWPPNHKMKNVLISGSATDAGSGIASVTFTVEDEYNLVEPTLTAFGQIIQLEAWRNGNDMDGRIYTITATATDNLGHVTTALTIVRVPHDQGN